MADKLGLDPARIERLRSSERLKYFDPNLIWSILKPPPTCTVLDIGTGVGFIALQFAKQYPKAKIYGCDILDGMIDLLQQDAAAQNLTNVHAITMQAATVDLADGIADIIVMAQLHHELDTPLPLLVECKRLLKGNGTIAIIDWKDEDNGKSPPAGRRVSEIEINAQLQAAGFSDPESHNTYEFHNFITAKP